MAVSRARQAVGPLYLLLCLLLGGSAQGILANMILQLVGVGLIAWSALARPGEPLGNSARQLIWLGLAAIALVALQLVPVPFSLWERLGGRTLLAADYATLGLAPALLPASLAPYRSLATLFSWIPPIALFCAMVRLEAYRASWMCAAVVAGTGAGIVLGALQVASPADATSSWYLFADSSFGSAIGFFANANHMADQLVITLPFLAALAAAARGSDQQLYTTVVASVAAAAIVVIVGIILNGSLAGYLLLLPALAGAGLILLPPRSPLRVWAAGAAGLLLLAAVAGIATTAVGSNRLSAEAATSVQSRAEMVAVGAQAVRDFMPLGAGLGTFPDAYHLYEDPASVAGTYVSHAHNDYIEVAADLGIGGIALIAAFFVWWAVATWRAWRAFGSQPYARAASVATAIILVHSLVDYPLRTAAIAACFAMGAALLAERRTPQANRQDLRPTRHLVFR
ncbi:MAG: O-antigen ligase family protein [Sphingomicrobium sp.]